MKKHVLVMGAALLSMGAMAQITVTDADFGSVGDSVFLATDFTPGVSVGTPGTNQTWNFSALNTVDLDTLFFLNPALTPFASDYPGANLATESEEGYVYFNKSASSVEVQGFATATNGIAVALQYNPAQTLISFPANFGTTYSSTSDADTREYVGIDTFIVICQVTVDSIQFKRHTTLSVNFDAWGSLQLPTRTDNVLRANTQEISTDSIFIYSPITSNCGLFTIPMGWSLAPDLLLQQIGYAGSVVTDTVNRYSWYGNGADFALCAITVDNNGNAVDATFQSDASQIGLGNPTEAGASISVFPNPTSDFLNFSGLEDGLYSVEILDLSGRKVLQSVLNSGSVSVSSLTKGLYIFQLSQGSSLIKIGKFEVTK